MKTYLLKLQSLCIAMGLTLGAVMVLSMFAWTIASAAGIADTKHNLGSAGTGVNKRTGTTEICVFCHTPHGADNTASVPLWNKDLTVLGPYTTYDSLGTTSLDGATAPIGSVSIACLSCHDGSQAMDAVLNAPGSGAAGDAAWTAGSFSGANQTAGKLTSFANLGTDLSNDHPIGIQYGGGGLTSIAPSGTLNDVDFKATSNANINGTEVWWVDTAIGTAAVREKTDMQLYTRTLSTVIQPFVECASCHDPHSDQGLFLRIDNTGSAVCLACHTK